MNFLKNSPAGIDIPIRAFQVFFYAQMKKRFGITDETAFDLYGRAHNNTNNGGSIPEVLINDSGGPGEYKDVMFDDSKAVGLGFFVTGDHIEYSRLTARAKIGLILQYTMTGITGGPYTPMHDEQVNQVVMSISQDPRYGLTFTGMIKRVDGIFKEYPKWKDSVKFSDMYPWHVLRLEFDLLYEIDGQYNCKY